MRQKEISLEDFKDVSMSDIKKEEAHEQWRCCSGSTTDARLVRFIAVYVVLLQLMLFCVFMLYKSKSCEESTTYVSLLTLLLGLVFPNPR